MLDTHEHISFSQKYPRIQSSSCYAQCPGVYCDQQTWGTQRHVRFSCELPGTQSSISGAQCPRVCTAVSDKHGIQMHSCFGEEQQAKRPAVYTTVTVLLSSSDLVQLQQFLSNNSEISPALNSAHGTFKAKTFLSHIKDSWHVAEKKQDRPRQKVGVSVINLQTW